ncbi:MAG TPA: sugar O-acetyltransferase, partial [Vampirovibrionales bacterium]
MNQSNSDKSMRQRMLAGEPYLAMDPELVELLARSQRILHHFNLSAPDAAQERQLLIQELFGEIGRGSEVKPPFRCDYGFNIFAGEGLFINYDCVILDCNTVRLGDRVLIGPKVQIYTATHPLNPAERKEGWESA